MLQDYGLKDKVSAPAPVPFINELTNAQERTSRTPKDADDSNELVRKTLPARDAVFREKRNPKAGARY
ncbi:MAG: hypothetical protein LBQ00_05915 [Syntrophobacterales bacterium]|jgi:hypothetical protein|nr:hypothetical protein [Syntrophobacterales bacterium]